MCILQVEGQDSGGRVTFLPSILMLHPIIIIILLVIRRCVIYTFIMNNSHNMIHTNQLSSPQPQVVRREAANCVDHNETHDNVLTRISPRIGFGKDTNIVVARYIVKVSN